MRARECDARLCSKSLMTRFSGPAALCFLGLAPPEVWIASHRNALILPLAKEFRVKVAGALVVGRWLFNDHRVGPSPRIFAAPGPLPAHTLPRYATSDSELSVCNFI